MSAVTETTDVDSVFEKAAERARANDLPYAGEVTPTEAWALIDAGRALLVDVRSTPEHRFVGRVPGSVHLPWLEGVDFEPNPDFLAGLEAVSGRDAALLLMCRSGKRSDSAARAAADAGFTRVYNVLEGFEGELDESYRRGSTDGWRFHGLPWEQD